MSGTDLTKTSLGSILIIDDDKFLADMYAMKFSQSGYSVQACLSAVDGLASMRGGFPADVILFDLIMPECDGYTFLQTLRDEKLGEHAIKIALSNQSDDSERNKAIELGADRLIIKASMIPSEVVNAVGEEIARRKK